MTKAQDFVARIKTRSAFQKLLFIIPAGLYFAGSKSDNGRKKVEKNRKENAFYNRICCDVESKTATKENERIKKKEGELNQNKLGKFREMLERARAETIVSIQRDRDDAERYFEADYPGDAGDLAKNSHDAVVALDLVESDFLRLRAITEAFSAWTEESTVTAPDAARRLPKSVWKPFPGPSFAFRARKKRSGKIPARTAWS